MQQIVEKFGSTSLTIEFESIIRLTLKNQYLRTDSFKNISAELKEFLAQQGITSSIEFSKSIYEVLHPGRSLCEKCGNTCNFISLKLGFKKFFNRYCSSCAKSSPEQIAMFKEQGRKRIGNLGAWSKESRNKRISTNLLLHGGTNVMASTKIKKKVQQTVLDRYGSKSSFIATEDGKKRWKAGAMKSKTDEVKAKQAQTNLRKYGVISKLIDSDVRAGLNHRRGESVQIRIKEKAPYIKLLEPYIDHKTQHHWKCTVCMSEFIDDVDDGSLPWCISCNGPNTQQGELYRFIKSLDVKLDVRYNSRSVIFPKELDIYLPEKKIAIEYNGVYWHANIIDKNHHVSKTEACKTKGIQLFHIFEDEWILKKQIWKSMIRIKLGFAAERIYARNCTVKSISYQDSKIFLEHCHLRGSVPSKNCYGLYYQEELVGVAIFGKPRYNKNVDLELLRISFKLDSHVVGGVGKLINHAIKELKPSSLLTYVDRTLGEGTAYEKIGFNLTSTTQVGYFYIKGYQRFHRTSFQKHKLQKKLFLFNKMLSERENMKNNGYNVIYDCGTNVFIKSCN